MQYGTVEIGSTGYQESDEQSGNIPTHGIVYQHISVEAFLASRPYADWLDERGDPRGAFIRLQVQYERMAEDDDPQRRGLERQKLAFLDDGLIAPLQANCIEPPDDDESELAVAKLGVRCLRARIEKRRQNWRG